MTFLLPGDTVEVDIEGVGVLRNPIGEPCGMPARAGGVMSTGAVGLSATDRQELHDLVIEHAWLLDHNQRHAVADLYVDDGIMSLGARTLNGRSDLLAWADQRATAAQRRTHHQCTNVRLGVDGSDAASGTVMLVLHVFDNGAAPIVELVGEYRDRCQRDGRGRWRFRQRQLQPLPGARCSRRQAMIDHAPHDRPNSGTASAEDRIVIRGGLLITQDDTYGVMSGDVLIDQGRIAAVGDVAAGRNVRRRIT